MNTTDTHPDTELLDQLRAGLLDDQPARKAELERHLQSCQACSRRFHLPTAVEADETERRRLQARLDQARHEAMRAGVEPRRRHTLIPVAAAAAVALVAVVLINPVQQNNGETQVANNTQEIPELYEDLDFYLWLSDHKQTDDSTT